MVGVVDGVQKVEDYDRGMDGFVGALIGGGVGRRRRRGIGV